jgi:hypothetical protein
MSSSSILGPQRTQSTLTPQSIQPGSVSCALEQGAAGAERGGLFIKFCQDKARQLRFQHSTRT